MNISYINIFVNESLFLLRYEEYDFNNDLQLRNVRSNLLFKVKYIGMGKSIIGATK